MKRLNARQLRTQEPDQLGLINVKKHPVYIILDSVLDTYNVGAIFRLADALAIEKIFLCGQTETPPNPRIKKASINTWKWVSWSYVSTAIEAINEIKTQNSQPKADRPLPEKVKIIAVEQDKKSVSLYDFKPEFPIAMVVGNETYGVSKEILEIADTIVEIPMWGVNKSLNVMVSCGIVLYRIAQYFSRD